MSCFYLTPEQDDYNKIPELQICIAEALYDVDSIVADPGAYTKEELATLHSHILSNLEWAWEISGGSEDQLLSTMMQISQVVAKEFKTGKGMTVAGAPLTALLRAARRYFWLAFRYAFRNLSKFWSSAFMMYTRLRA